MKTSDTQSIPLAEIRRCPLLPALPIDQKHLARCAARLSKGGLEKPLLLRPAKEVKEGAKFELIWGDPWLAAAKQLGWTTIASRVENLSDQQALVKSLREASDSGELSSFARAKGYRQLLDPPFGLSTQLIATEMGLKDATSVRRFAALLTQPAEIVELLSLGTLHEGHLRYLNRVKDLKQRVTYAKRAAREGWSTDRLAKHLGRPGRQPSAKRGTGRGYDYNGFHLVWGDGDRILFSGREYHCSRESPAKFASELQAALECCIRDRIAEQLGSPPDMQGVPAPAPPQETTPPKVSAMPKDEAASADPLASLEQGLEMLAQLAKKFGSTKE